jgi:hypothetical protein
MSDVNQLEMKARIGEILNRWPAVGLTVGVSATDASGSSTDTSFADVPPNYTSLVRIRHWPRHLQPRRREL